MTRFGRRAPSPRELVEQFSRATGETVVPSGVVAAHGLGLTTQVPVRPVYLTSGTDRRLELGKQILELRNAPSWQLWGAGTREGAVLRAVSSRAPFSLRRPGPPPLGMAESFFDLSSQDRADALEVAAGRAGRPAEPRIIEG